VAVVAADSADLAEAASVAEVPAAAGRKTANEQCIISSAKSSYLARCKFNLVFSSISS
jgi:hypothetical protein